LQESWQSHSLIYNAALRTGKQGLIANSFSQ